MPRLAEVLLVAIFVLGVGNFAMHRAVLESGHPVLGRLRDLPRATRLLLLGLEYAVLVAALLLVYRGQPGWGWAYALYTLANAMSAWLILSRRM